MIDPSYPEAPIRRPLPAKLDRAIERGLNVEIPVVFAWSDGGEPKIYPDRELTAREAAGRQLLRDMGVPIPEDDIEPITEANGGATPKPTIPPSCAWGPFRVYWM